MEVSTNSMTDSNDPHNEIVLYQPDSSLKLEVRLEDETVWLNRQQMAQLFDRDVKTIGKHISNALSEELLGFPTAKEYLTVQNKGDGKVVENPVVAKFATTAADGKIYQVEYYNLDVVLSVGYRVKSQRGIQFRVWSNRVLKNYLLRGYAVNQRFERIEHRLGKTEKKIDFFVRTALPPVQGVLAAELFGEAVIAKPEVRKQLAAILREMGDLHGELLALFEGK